MNNIFVFLCMLSMPTTILTGSHSFCMLTTNIKGQTPFPQFSVTFKLDDITVGHYNSEAGTYIPRENTTNEDMRIFYINNEMKELQPFLDELIKSENQTEGPLVSQLMTMCEVSGNEKAGKLFTTYAIRGSTRDEMNLLNNKLTYQGTRELTKLQLEINKWVLETIIYKRCIRDLKYYLDIRGIQVKKKVKPRVRLIQKANLDSGGFHVSCLATGFYPRHINLTLFRDGQSVADHEITGGDLLPNGDGTYQMRKSLEISAADKHKYTCSATHLSLDNKLDVLLEFDHGEPFKSVIPSVLTVLALMLVFGVAAAIIVWKRRRADSNKSGYSTASTSEESMHKKSEIM
ncbi:DLA class I histocompatibility antigen, A9/A9 alpha chain-like [Labeo rohita]|uniref:DLA class I histocompatibility antigen, A9/A9 alpha chain-like n=1 Tax=Labeo rohita TaxID=84645 RepID=UPI0021E1F520|nr:DLA class I histocompatibility antigen, A9/A9 alpha chain-like [Labeo rohita]